MANEALNRFRKIPSFKLNQAGDTVTPLTSPRMRCKTNRNCSSDPVEHSGSAKSFDKKDSLRPSRKLCNKF
jgi:hypothetical protein